jgi:hypothetical protein
MCKLMFGLSIRKIRILAEKINNAIFIVFAFCLDSRMNGFLLTETVLGTLIFQNDIIENDQTKVY